MAYYIENMPGYGWQIFGEPIIAEGEIILQFAMGEEGVIIRIESQDSIQNVEILED